MARTYKAPRRGVCRGCPYCTNARREAELERAAWAEALDALARREAEAP
jgi:hypothetical protein